VRCMDVDPFEPVGISVETGRFLDAFLLYCALQESAKISEEEGRIHTANFARTVKEGRRPGLTLMRDGAEVLLTDWGRALLEQIRPVAQLLDRQRGGTAHVDALNAQLPKLDNPELTPSARALREIRELHGSYTAFGLRQSERHAAYFRSRPPSAEEQAYFSRLAAISLEEQAELERTQTGNFDDFVAAYRASNLCKDFHETPC
jgi:glutamate--cysteine ligase